MSANVPALQLIIDVTASDKKGLLKSFDSQTYVPFSYSFRDDYVPVVIRCVQPSTSGTGRFWDDIDITEALVSVAIDMPDLVPQSGQFELTYQTINSPALSYPITASAMAAALNNLSSIVSAGGVTVTPEGNDFAVFFTAAGARDLIQETNISLFPFSSIFIYEAQAGTTSASSVQIISFAQNPASFNNIFSPLPDAGYSVVSTQTGSPTGTIVPSTQTLTLTPIPYDGSFTATTAIGTTGAIAATASSQIVATALNAIAAAAGRYTVTGASGGPFAITDALGDNTAITCNVSGLIVPIGVSGVLSLNTPSMRARFEGVSTANVTLDAEVKLQFSGSQPYTVMQCVANVYREVIRNGAVGASPAYPSTALLFVNNDFSITGFVGGGANNLDGIGTLLRLPLELHAITVFGKFCIYRLITGTQAESVPNIIRPDDFDAANNPKVWQLESITDTADPVPIINANGTITALTGGSPNGLDGVVTAGGATPPNTLILFNISGVVNGWWIRTGTDATSTGIQRPLDFNASTNAVVWQRII